MASNLKRLEKKAMGFQTKMEGALSDIENEAQESCDFPIYATLLDGDGVCIMSSETNNGVSIDGFMAIVRKHGRVTIENFDSYL